MPMRCQGRPQVRHAYLHKQVMREGCQLLQAHEHHIIDLACSPGPGQEVEDAPAAQQHSAHSVGWGQEGLPRLGVQSLVPRIVGRLGHTLIKPCRHVLLGPCGLGGLLVMPCRHGRLVNQAAAVSSRLLWMHAASHTSTDTPGMLYVM